MPRPKPEVTLGWTVVKKHADPVRFAEELRFYLLVPWAAPELHDFGPDWLEIEHVRGRRPEAADKPALRALLDALHTEGVNHRDAHTKNVVMHPSRGPLLIDWEFATDKPGVLSYDLHGPQPSCRQPAEQGGPPMWWDAKSKWALGRL